MSAAASRYNKTDKLGAAFKQVRGSLVTVAIFSLFINLLMLVGPLYMLQIYDRVLTSGQVETLIFLTLIAGIAIMVMAMLETLRSTLTVRIGGWFSQAMGPEFLAGSVRARLQGARNGAQPLRDVQQIQNFIAHQGMIAFFDAPWVPIFIVIIFLLHPMLGMVAVITALSLLILSIINDLVARQPNKEAGEANLEAITLAETAVRRSEEVEAMGFMPNLVARWSQFNEKAIHALNRAGETNGLIVAITKFIRFFAQVAILGVGAWLVLQQEATPGTMIAASIMLGRALAPVEMALGSWKNFISARQAHARLREHANHFPAPAVRMKMPEPEGNVTVSDLSFTPPGSSTQILKGMSFELKPREAVAVIGPSGAGKSTMCRMLLGLNRPDHGEIHLDGANIHHWDARQLGRNIGYLPQDVELFPGTVGENIARMDQVDDDKVFHAAKLSHAHDVIQYLPDGYDTMIGDGGLRLSGGQRQRIGLARAVYNQPRLIVLDEPNANLDQPGEQALSDAIENLKGLGCALVIVGHRPSTVAQADKIMLVQNGLVSLFGPRDEVLQALAPPGAEPPPAGSPQDGPPPVQAGRPQTSMPRQRGTGKSGWTTRRQLPAHKFARLSHAGWRR